MKRIVYSEPTEFFPEEIRKKCKLGEYAEKAPEIHDYENNEDTCAEKE